MIQILFGKFGEDAISVVYWIGCMNIPVYMTLFLFVLDHKMDKIVVLSRGIVAIISLFIYTSVIFYVLIFDRISGIPGYKFINQIQFQVVSFALVLIYGFFLHYWLKFSYLDSETMERDSL